MKEAIGGYLLALKMILRDSKLIKLCVVPWAVGVVFFFVWMISIWSMLFDPFFQSAILVLDFSLFAGIFSGILVFLIASIGSVFSILIVNEFTTESFARRVVGNLTGKIPPARPLMQQFVDSIIRLVIIVMLSLTSLLVGLIPLMQPVALMISAYCIGIMLSDFGLCVKGFNLSERLSTMRSRFLVVLMVGLFFLPAFIVPFLSLFLLPLGYAASLIALNGHKESSFLGQDTPL